MSNLFPPHKTRMVCFLYVKRRADLHHVITRMAHAYARTKHHGGFGNMLSTAFHRRTNALLWAAAHSPSSRKFQAQDVSSFVFLGAGRYTINTRRRPLYVVSLAAAAAAAIRITSTHCCTRIHNFQSWQSKAGQHSPCCRESKLGNFKLRICHILPFGCWMV